MLKANLHGGFACTPHPAPLRPQGNCHGHLPVRRGRDRFPHTHHTVGRSTCGFACTSHRAGNTPRSRPRGGFRGANSPCASPCTELCAGNTPCARRHGGFGGPKVPASNSLHALAWLEARKIKRKSKKDTPWMSLSCGTPSMTLVLSCSQHTAGLEPCGLCRSLVYGSLVVDGQTTGKRNKKKRGRKKR
jgi:hypothetical protein